MSRHHLFAIVLGGVLTVPAAAQDRAINGTVTDADGKPIAGVEVAHSWHAHLGRLFPSEAVTTAADGTFTLAVPRWMKEVAVLAYTADRGRAAIAVADPAANPALALRLAPVARVSGQFDCPDLGRRPTSCHVFIQVGKSSRPLQCQADRAAFDFPLPPGEFTFQAACADAIAVKKPIITMAGQSLDLGTISLEATAVAKMVGKPAVPWAIKDARGLPKTAQLADLKGKWVLIDFWGYWCGPCVRQLADLIDLYELHADHRDQFEIVAIHDSSVADFAAMDQKLTGVKNSIWAGRDLPFPVVLDDAGQTVKAYTVQGWPTTILIDPEGKVVGEVDPSILDSKLPKPPPGARAKQALNKNMGANIVGSMSLSKLPDTLLGYAGVLIRLDEPGLAAKGVDVKASFPIHMPVNVTLRSWLDLHVAHDGLIATVYGNDLLITPGEPQPPSPRQVKAAAELTELLKQPVKFDLPATTLDGLGKYVRELTGEAVVLDPAARRAGRLKPETAVPATKLDGRPLGEAFRSVLDPLGLEVAVRYEVFVIQLKK